MTVTVASVSQGWPSLTLVDCLQGREDKAASWPNARLLFSFGMAELIKPISDWTVTFPGILTTTHGSTPFSKWGLWLSTDCQRTYTNKPVENESTTHRTHRRHRSHTDPPVRSDLWTLAFHDLCGWKEVWHRSWDAVESHKSKLLHALRTSKEALCVLCVLCVVLYAFYAFNLIFHNWGPSLKVYDTYSVHAMYCGLCSALGGAHCRYITAIVWQSLLAPRIERIE